MAQTHLFYSQSSVLSNPGSKLHKNTGSEVIEHSGAEVVQINHGRMSPEPWVYLPSLHSQIGEVAGQLWTPGDSLH